MHFECFTEIKEAIRISGYIAMFRLLGLLLDLSNSHRMKKQLFLL